MLLKLFPGDILLRGLVKRDVLTDAEAHTILEEIAGKRDWLGAPIYRYALEKFRLIS